MENTQDDTSCKGYCYGKNPATLTNVWNGDRWCPECAKNSWGVKTDPLTVDDLDRELCDAIRPHEGDYQTQAITTIATLLMYQQRRIEALEARVAELTTTKENEA